MSKNDPPNGEGAEAIHIVVGLPAPANGTYQYQRDGTVVHGDASGEWTLDDDGEVGDILFFLSPRRCGGEA
jgi:hypothetical protein